MVLPRRRWLWPWLWCCWATAAATRRDRALWTPATFDVQTTLLLNSAERYDREIGYRIVAELSVAPAHPPPSATAPASADEEDLLLRFQLEAVQLQVRGAHRSAEWAARASAWDALGGGGAWFARLRRGALRAAYLDPADDPDAKDYKKSLLSLFQIAASDGEHNETDISGECVVAYETLSSTVFRKIKRACSFDGADGVSARRVARYTLDAGGALLAVHAEELLTLHDALKARSWHALARRAAPAAAPARAASLPAALAAVPAALADTPLAPQPPEPDDEDATEDLNSAIRRNRAAVEGEAAGEGGGAEAARALLRLLPALRAAPLDRLRAALDREEHRDLLPGLCRALGLAGTGAAVRAARGFLQLAGRDPLEPLAHAFLAGFALAPRAHADAVLGVLELGEEARRAAVAESALLAAAAAAAAGDDATRAAVRDALARGLARCKDAECQAVRLLALGNLRADAAETLVAHAERDAPRAAAAALSALRAAPALGPRHLARLGRLVTNASLPLEVRAAALELVVARRAADESGAVPAQLVQVAGALHAERSRAAHELRRVLWQRLDSLRDAPPVRALMPLLPPELRTLDARAHAGTSSVLRRDTGWGGGAAGGWRARLDSVQLAAGGLLRRGAVALLAVAPDNSTTPEIEVEIWTRGLESIAGGGDESRAEGEAEVEPEGAAGGLALSVGGARMRDIALFDGQAELLGHVWAGTGSAPTAVLRALRPLREWRAALPLLCGATLRARAAAASAAALDAHAAVSLWHRTARGALRLRGALAAHATADVRTAWGSLRARAALHAEPRLRIALELDFYDGVALCVRAAEPDHVVERSLELESVLGSRRLRVSRGARGRLAVAGRTLALGRANDVACRTLRAQDDDDDDPQ